MDPRATITIGRSLAVQRVGLGLVPLGNMFRDAGVVRAHDTLEQWWTLGLRTFDVAPVYGYGLAERRLGEFLKGKPRDQFIVSTKVGRCSATDAPDDLWVALRDRLGIALPQIPGRRQHDG